MLNSNTLNQSYPAIPSSLLDLAIIPLVVLAYSQSLQFSSMLNLSRLNFYLILFLMIHTFSSLLFVCKGYEAVGQWRPSVAIVGMGPTVIAMLTLLIVRILPFLKWPFSLFSSLPFYDIVIDPLIMGLSAYLTHLLLNKALLPSLYGTVSANALFQPTPVDELATTHESVADSV
jgi:hypothetical protein